TCFYLFFLFFFFFSSRRRHTRFSRDWSSDVCSSDLAQAIVIFARRDALSAARDLLFHAGAPFWPPGDGAPGDSRRSRRELFGNQPEPSPRPSIQSEALCRATRRPVLECAPRPSKKLDPPAQRLHFVHRLDGKIGRAHV